jgi:1-acyl-sn-glycerol-3-phosphate acyltransferase
LAGREKGGFWVGVAAALLYPAAMLGRRDYRRAERIPREGPALLVLNHVSHMDPAVDAVFVHRQKRVPRFLAKESVATAPVFGKIFLGSGGIPVYRGSATAVDSLRAAHQALQDGKIVVIYPEGTITKDDVPVIPIARWGTNFIFDGYTKKLRPFPRQTVTHLVGEPVDLSGYRGRKARGATLREVTELMMDEVTALLAEIRHEQPPAKKPDDTTADDGRAGKARRDDSRAHDTGADGGRS